MNPLTESMKFKSRRNGSQTASRKTSWMQKPQTEPKPKKKKHRKDVLQ